MKKVGNESFLGVDNLKPMGASNLAGVFQFKLCIQDDQEIIYNGEYYEGATYSEMGFN